MNMNVIFINVVQPLEILEKNAMNFATDKYWRVRNLNQKSYPILKWRDRNVCNFPKKSKKEKTIEKLNKLIQLLKDEEI